MESATVDSARFSLQCLMNKGMATANAEQTILLVDKDLDYLNWATKHLEAKGLRILRCDNGENAIKAVSYTHLTLPTKRIV